MMKKLLLLPVLCCLIFVSYSQIQQDAKAKQLEEMRLLKQKMEAEQKSKPANEVKSKSEKQKAQTGYEYSYIGFIGSYPIHFEFNSTGSYDCPRGGSTFEGFYYYDKSGASNKLLLKGYCCGASIHFTEYNTSGNSTGSFSGIWGGDDIEGSWSNAGKEFGFKLHALDSETAQTGNQNTKETTPGIDYSQLDPDEAGDGVEPSYNEPVTNNAAGNRNVDRQAHTTPTNIGNNIESKDITTYHTEDLSVWEFLQNLYRSYHQEVNGVGVLVVIFTVLIIIYDQRKQNTLLKKQNDLLEGKIKP